MIIPKDPLSTNPFTEDDLAVFTESFYEVCPAAALLQTRHITPPGGFAEARIAGFDIDVSKLWFVSHNHDWCVEYTKQRFAAMAKRFNYVLFSPVGQSELAPFPRRVPGVRVLKQFNDGPIYYNERWRLTEPVYCFLETEHCYRVRVEQYLYINNSLADNFMDNGMTVREWFSAVQRRLVLEGEGFSGKRPLGNSDWQDKLAAALGCGEETGSEDEGFDIDIDWDEYDVQVEKLFDELASPTV